MALTQSQTTAVARPGPASGAAAPALPERPQVEGKFLRRGDERLWVRGVTYGPFRPGPDGEPYQPDAVERDFAQIAASGFNTIRLYTCPPRWLLDAAARHGLLVLAGLAWEQHIAFLDDPGRARAIVARVAEQVRPLAGHPALLAWAVGNEIPSPVVRWHGAGRVRDFLARLHASVKAEDPGALVTYVNYPSTEYLDLDFLDVLCFNVFLEDRGPFDAYLARLQNLAGDRPLVLTEIGLDSGSHGEERQAEVLDWSVRTVFAAGAAGACVFAWTDEWHRGGLDIEDWHFGLTDRQRRPKPALAAVRRAFADAPIALGADAPAMSVVVCTYNGSRTLGETCEALSRLQYPDFEVIVVDDGSTDGSAELAGSYGFRVISTPNRGLSAARNTGWQEARGEIVAYVDDDAAPDPHWLTYLAEAYRRSDHAAMGGPNLPVPGDGAVADAVAVAPGNPMHVLVDDRVAEHIPGCNSSFRRSALAAIGGFDERFHVAGDDVDVCWRLQERGWTIGFAPAALVWHHRRRDIGGFLRQQRGYGRAEAMLERKWPERYTAGGHVTWHGRLYGDSAPRHATGPLRWRIYHGVWGSAPFQRLYEPARGDLNTMVLMPEAYLAIGALAALVALGALWHPLLFLAPLLVATAGALAVRALAAATGAQFPTPGLGPAALAQRRLLAAAFHLAQPLARLEGRLRHGLTPWRRRGGGPRAFPRPRRMEHWSERWVDPIAWVQSFEGGLVAIGAVVRRGGDFDSWDLEVRGGTLAGVRISTMVEEHGQGRQLARLRCRPVWSRPALLLIALLTALAVGAGLSGAGIAAAIIGVLAGALLLRTFSEASAATGAALRALAPADRERSG